MIPENFVPDIQSVQAGYANGKFTPRELVSWLYQKAENYPGHNIWITRLTPEQIEPYLSYLVGKSTKELPLYGVPFVLKDNINLAGVPTTAACPGFAHTPDRSAFIVQKLLSAGAIPLGKTNMDQFATGLVGTRSPEPWGPCRNAFDPDYISGGSSSGSAVAVALGLASFSLGTDTAGSGRVPAMLNNLVGLKPSRGLFSMTGVLPACRSLDCPSIFALNTADAQKVFTVMAQPDSADAYSRKNPFSNSGRSFGTVQKTIKIGMPFSDQMQFFGEAESASLFDQLVLEWQKLGAEIVEVDIEPLLSAARMLYEGPWVAERYVAMQEIMQDSPELVHPVVRRIVEGAIGKTAADTYQAEYQMQAYRVQAKHLFEQVDCLLTPTAPRHYAVEEVLADPIRLNSNMGFYTNYMNLLDLCGLAVPAGFYANGLPFGYTLVAPAFKDTSLLNIANYWERALQLPLGASGQLPQAVEPLPAPAVSALDNIEVAVCGAHLEGLPLNWQLKERGAELVKKTRTSHNYRMYLLDQSAPIRPGLIRNEGAGVAIEVEVWSVPASDFGSFVANIPYPLGIGKLELEDGSWVSGFVCEALAVQGMRDISDHGAWREFIASATQMRK
ncbi:MAG: allophanate hydrolase [Porticoccaceae bacterium]